jgi:broad specificity phosphatase PhoE
MITIWFEPHSTTIDNEAGRASGWNDIDLSKLGVEQTKQPIQRSRERKIQVIFTSDLQRAVKTAVPTADELKIPIYVDARLRECDYGDFTQKPKGEIDAQKPKRITESYPNGESYAQCAERVGEFLKWLKTNFDGQTVMIVGHRATQYGLEHHIVGKPLLDCVTEPWSYQPGFKYEL